MSKNYSEQGGDKWVVGGTLEFKEGSEVIGLAFPVLKNQTESTAEDHEALLEDFNLLLGKLKEAGLMESD